MPYSQYTTLQSLRQKLNIKTHSNKLFNDIEPLAPSSWLKETLTRYAVKRTAYFNEKSRSEAIVFPILSEMQSYHQHKFALYSGAIIEGDKELGLNGECDFVLSQAEQSIELERPVFCIVEAKDNDIELGIPQCIAQLYGSQLYNARAEGIAAPHTLYGAVTTGTEWNFLQLIGHDIIIDEELYSIKNLPELLGVLNQVMLQYV